MTIYTTLEPCTMCFGTILNARIKKVVYSLEDLYGGATCLKRSHMPERHQIGFPHIIGGLLREETKELFKNFFRATKNSYWSSHPENPLVKTCLA
jgi:tRNA(adenine34) deaminase